MKCMERYKQLIIRNSTVEFLIFTKQAGGDGISVMVADENVWLTQDMIAMLFDKKRNTIAEHLQTLYADKELDESQVCRKFRQTSEDGNYTYKFYNLEAIIAVGFKVNSERAVQFRQWAAGVLKDFSLKGYVLDKKRLENGVFLNDDYFKRLLEEIREIRLSERMFYQKVTDIYATAMDYDRNNRKTKLFYKTVQNKLHYAIHRHTAAELIVGRADAGKEHMGLTTWEKAPHGKIVKSDVSIAKNYLSKAEMRSLSRTAHTYDNGGLDKAP